METRKVFFDFVRAFITRFLIGLCIIAFFRKGLIYNEEILVALSFFSFVFFVFKFYGNTIRDSLDERSATIREEFQMVGTEKLKSLQQLLKEYKTLASVQVGLQHVLHYTLQELREAIRRGNLGLRGIFLFQIDQKLRTLAVSTTTIQQSLQESMANDILGLVHLQYKQTNQTGSLAPAQIEEAITLISVE